MAQPGFESVPNASNDSSDSHPTHVLDLPYSSLPRLVPPDRTDPIERPESTRRPSITSDWFDELKNLIQNANDRGSFPTPRDNVPTSTHQASKPSPAVPHLKPHLFHSPEIAFDKSRADVVVVYMLGSITDESDISIFVRDEKPRTLAVPPTNAKKDTDSIKKSSFETQQRQAQTSGGQAKSGNDYSAISPDRLERGEATKAHQDTHGMPAPPSKPTEKNTVSSSNAAPSPAKQTTEFSANPQTKQADQPLAQPKAPPPRKGINWLSGKGMLPESLPDSRIFGLGFDLSSIDAPINFDGAASKLVEVLTCYRALDCPKELNPVVFIGHGYGAVVIEKLLSNNYDQGSSGQQIVFSTASVHLFAPPIDGSSRLIDWTVQGLKSRNDFRSIDIKGTPMFSNIWNTFKTSLRDLKTRGNVFVSVYREKNPTRVSLPSQVITDGSHPEDNPRVIDSSTKKKQPEDPIPAFEYLTETNEEDFAQIATFSGPKDGEFQSLVERLKKAVQTRQLLGATELGHDHAVDDLLDHSVNVNLSNRFNQTALLVAADYGEAKCARILLSIPGVEFDHQDNDGNTALHLAVRSKKDGSYDIAEELLKTGAEMYISNKEKPPKTARSLSREVGSELIRKLLRHPPTIRGPPERKRDFLDKTTPPNHWGDRACTRNWVAGTEVFLTPSNDKIAPEPAETHRNFYSSIKRFIYSDTSVEDICVKERPLDQKFLAPEWRWFHIPSNNMAWVHDLFVKLGIPKRPWSRHYRDGGFPHSRCMSAESVVLPNLSDSHTIPHYDVLAIFMPYISYEESAQQVDMSNLIDLIHQKGPKGLDPQDNFTETVGEVESEHEGDNRSSHSDDRKLGVSERDYGTNHDLPEQKEEREPIPEIHLQRTDASEPEDLSGVKTSIEPEILEVQPGDSAPKSEEQEGDTLTYDSDDDDDDDEDREAEISAYLIHDPPLHPRRTLDQSYYHMLPSTSARDADQVVARRAIKEYRKKWWNVGDESKGEECHNVLMVDQLWLWFIKPTGESQDRSHHGSPPKNVTLPTIITSFPSRKTAPSNDDREVERVRILEDLQINAFKNPTDEDAPTIRTPQDLVSRLLALCCRTLDRHQNVKPLQFLQFFQSTIGDAEADETTFFEDFRSITEELYNLHEHNPDYQKRRSNLLKMLLNIRRESRLLQDIKDVRDEIKMINAVLADQVECLNSPSLSHFFEPPRQHTSAKSQLVPDPKPHPFHDATKFLMEAKADFEVMETHAKKIEEGLNHLMQLKQMQGNLWEARSSREGADENARQGNTLLVFTVVTIIFLPLSFMASFFALAVQQFPKDDNGNTSWPLGRVSGLLFGISFAVSLLFLFVAFKISLFTKPWQTMRKIFIREFLLWLVQYLRFSRDDKMRAYGYHWYKRLSTELYEYQTVGRDEFEPHARERGIWLEGFSWKINHMKHPKPKEPKAPKLWEFNQVRLYILRGPEADNVDEKPEEAYEDRTQYAEDAARFKQDRAKYYDGLAKYGELLWKSWPEGELREERRRYRDILWDVNDNDESYYDPGRPEQYTDFISSIWAGDGWDYEKHDLI